MAVRTEYYRGFPGPVRRTERDRDVADDRKDGGNGLSRVLWLREPLAIVIGPYEAILRVRVAGNGGLARRVIKVERGTVGELLVVGWVVRHDAIFAAVINRLLPAGDVFNDGAVASCILSAYYSATKHALEGYSESLDHEVRAFNIRVSIVEPAYTRSVFDQNALEPDAKLQEYEDARAGTQALLRDVMPKADPPELVADVVLRAATATRPRRRYTAGKIASQISLLRRLSPAEIFDKSLRKQLRLPV